MPYMVGSIVFIFLTAPKIANVLSYKPFLNEYVISSKGKSKEISP